MVGLDNMNDYYDINLKIARLANAGIVKEEIQEDKMVTSSTCSRYRFIKLDITQREQVNELFEEEKFEAVINMAGQAGVRYSIENPYAYIESNVMGFLNILECCRHNPVKHLIFASSSSIYGMSDHHPYSEDDNTDSPVSLYAATKKSDELMAYSYSKLYGIPATGVRFFTVYGPWGRPDMAPFIFLKSTLEGKPIKVFNHGDLSRDFTYISDIVQGLMCILEHPSQEAVPYRVYNIGESAPVNLLNFISLIEKVTGRQAIKEMEGMQPGDVYCTYADTSHLQHDLGYSPQVSIEKGVELFYEWYMSFYKG